MTLLNIQIIVQIHQREMSEEQKPQITAADLPKLRQLKILLIQKQGDGKNPVSLLNECSQKSTENFGFNLSHSPAGFSCEAVYANIKITATGSQKKQAKTNAAKALVNFVINFNEENHSEQDYISNSTTTEEKPAENVDWENIKPGLDVSSEATTSVQTTQPVINRTEVWGTCLDQLKHKVKDSVVMLAIFAINTSTGAPRYQVTEKTKDNKKITVMVSCFKIYNMK